MYRMRNPVRPYAWGSRTALPSLLGQSPSGEPQAELWMGAHAADPSWVETPVGERPLNEVIAEEPASVLGEPVAQHFQDHLPYLLKVLAAEEPLSLQAHPTADRATVGFREEERRGVPLDAPQRIYKDTNHKPEMIVALSWFHALCGFRRLDRTADLFDLLGVARLRDIASDLRERGEPALRDAVVELFATPQAARAEFVGWVSAACRSLGESGGEWGQEARWVASLARHYPGDPGVVVALMLNHVRLRPGEALFLPAGNLHAYLHGVGVEVMANSDNVVRGGLTVKHVDVAELLEVLDTTPRDVPLVVPRKSDGEARYAPPVEEFELVRLSLRRSSPHVLVPGRPRILLVTRGSAVVASAQGELELTRGQSCFVRADDPEVRVTGLGDLYHVEPAYPA